MIVVVNKWDLLTKNNHTMKQFDTDLREAFSFMPYAMVIYVSALSGQRVGKIVDLVDLVMAQYARRLSSSRLNEVVNEATLLNPTPSDKGKKMKLFYASQVGTKPPTIVFFVNDPELMHFSYLRYLENQLRENFGFVGTPLRLKVRGRNEE